MSTVTIKATAPSADDQGAIKAAIASLKQKRRLSGCAPPHDKVVGPPTIDCPPPDNEVWVPPQSIVSGAPKQLRPSPKFREGRIEESAALGRALLSEGQASDDRTLAR